MIASLPPIPGNLSLFWNGAVLFLLAFGYATIYLLRGKDHRPSIFYLLMTIGFACLSMALYERGLVAQSFPLHNTFEILHVIAWTAVMLEFVIRPAFRLRMLGYFTAGLAAALSLSALLVPSWDQFPANLTPGDGNPWIGFHAALAVFSYGIFSLLATTSGMYLLQHNSLQRKSSGGLYLRMPAVRQLAEINQRLLLMGVSVLTISIAIGFANWIKEPESVSSVKLITALVVWAAYLIAHWLRQKKRVIATQFAWACLWLFILALISLWPLTAKGI